MLYAKRGNTLWERNAFQAGALWRQCFCSFFATAIYSNCLSLYMHPVCDNLQLSSTTPWSMINLIAAFASAGGAMAIAGLYQGKHFKLFMLLCIAASGALFALASICTAIWQFYIVFCLSNIFLAWFEDKRSVAMSIAFCGSGVGTAIWSPVLSKIIASSNVGYKHAFVFSGAVVTVALVIICLLLVKRCPEEYGQEPYRPKRPRQSPARLAQWLAR